MGHAANTAWISLVPHALLSNASYAFTSSWRWGKMYEISREAPHLKQKVALQRIYVCIIIQERWLAPSLPLSTIQLFYSLFDDLFHKAHPTAGVPIPIYLRMDHYISHSLPQWERINCSLALSRILELMYHGAGWPPRHKMWFLEAVTGLTMRASRDKTCGS